MTKKKTQIRKQVPRYIVNNIWALLLKLQHFFESLQQDFQLYRINERGFGTYSQNLFPWKYLSETTENLYIQIALERYERASHVERSVFYVDKNQVS